MENNKQSPIPGYWYINRAGKLMRVRFVTYVENVIESVLIQYIEGASQSISIHDWHGLDLMIPPYDQGDQLLESDNTL